MRAEQQKIMSEDKQITIIGCGHIGKLLARQLLDKGITLSGIVSSDSSLSECRDRNIPCKIIDLDQPVSDIDLSQQCVIYLAPPPPRGTTDTRITNFLHAIDKHPPERFVLISTTGVYGDCHGEWVDEATPLNPAADRAFRRADAEQQVQRFCRHHGIPLVILRVPGIYGPGRIPLDRIRKGLPVVKPDESPYTNRIHADDLVDICEQALLDTGITGIYNVSDGHPGTMYEYFTGIAAALNLPPPPVISLAEAQQQLSPGMLSYLAESRRIDNKKLLKDFSIVLTYPDLTAGLRQI